MQNDALSINIRKIQTALKEFNNSTKECQSNWNQMTTLVSEGHMAITNIYQQCISIEYNKFKSQHFHVKTELMIAKEDRRPCVQVFIMDGCEEIFNY